MKRVITISALAILAVAAIASAQQTAAANRPLAQVAREEEARRQSIRKPAKVYTNNDLRSDTSIGVAGPPAGTTAATSGNASPSNVTPGAPSVNLPGGTAPPAPAQAQAYWQNRIKDARTQVTRSQMFADSLQTRINSLRTDFVNRDDPAQKAQIERDLNAALAELERVKKELDDNTKKITTIEDEARRAGVPPGWLRPGA